MVYVGRRGSFGSVCNNYWPVKYFPPFALQTYSEYLDSLLIRFISTFESPSGHSKTKPLLAWEAKVCLVLSSAQLSSCRHWGCCWKIHINPCWVTRNSRPGGAAHHVALLLCVYKSMCVPVHT